MEKVHDLLVAKMSEKRINLSYVFLHNTLNIAIFEFKKRSLDTYFGWVWSVISPLSQMAILLFILIYVFKSPQEHLVLWLISGITVWTFIQTSILKTCQSIVSRRGMIQNQNISQDQIVMADLLSEFLIFSPFLILAITVAFIEQTYSLKLFWIIYLVLTLLIFLFGIALGVATITVFMRDLPHLIGIVLQVAFWLTPIAYAKSTLNPYIAMLISLNPFTHFVELSQNIFLNKPITIENIVIPLVLAAITMVVGWMINRKLRRKVAIFL